MLKVTLRIIYSILAQDTKLYDIYFDKVDQLRTKIADDSEAVLSAIDPQKLIDNPMEYLMKMGMLFFEAHQKELEKAIKLGEGRARKVLGEIKKG